MSGIRGFCILGLLQADHAASRDFDKAIMTLAAGALGVSIAFVHDVASHPVRVAWLGWAWGLFAASLVLILLSFLISQHALRREMKVLSGVEIRHMAGRMARPRDDRVELDVGRGSRVRSRRPGRVRVVQPWREVIVVTSPRPCPKVGRSSSFRPSPMERESWDGGPLPREGCA